jgi:hypothetical protein
MGTHGDALALCAASSVEAAVVLEERVEIGGGFG